MPAFRRAKNLTCFYCGRRTSTPNDGHVRRFECPNCEATNYLDKNGEITDPPIHATASAADESHARPGRLQAAPPRSIPSSGEVFCEKCLKNQQLFTRSLAQYLPDDPEDPEYEERERNYYTFRKGLEKRYPQVCAECEPKVLERITQAGYTAKTDHLRRMIDRSREVRSAGSARGLLDLVAGAGRCLWVAGLVLQAVWHLQMVLVLLAGEDRDVFRGSQYIKPIGAWLLPLLPDPEIVVKWSLVATVVSLWWNPYFVKTYRGFTKHIKGLPAWYTYQAMIMFLRIIALAIPSLNPEERSKPAVQVAAHAFMTFFILCVSKLSLASVRTDTTPLFAPTPVKGPGSVRDDAPEPRKGPATSMADILDEVLLASPSTSGQDSHSSGIQLIGDSPLTGRSPSRSRYLPGGSFGHELAARQSQQDVQYDMEMDWTPTQSKHRAFNTFGAPEQPLRGFGSAPVEDEERRQFWYKVPPAPTSIARRALNPPQTALLRKQPPLSHNSNPFAGAGSLDESGVDGGKSMRDGHRRDDVAFKETSFHPQEDGSDPRGSLSDIFGQAFTISPPTEGPGAEGSGRRGGGRLGSEQSVPPDIRLSGFSDMAPLALSLLLLFSKSATFVPSEHSAHLALAVCCVSMLVWAWAIIRSKSIDSDRLAMTLRPWVCSVVGQFFIVVELALVLRIAAFAWAAGRIEACLDIGHWFIGTLAGHQAWNLLLRSYAHDKPRREAPRSKTAQSN